MRRGERPQAREAYKKVKDALELVRLRRRSVGLHKHLIQMQDFLQVAKEEEIWPLIEELLVELLQCGPINSYAGKFPPEKSYEREMKDIELWAFCWLSSSTNCKAYLKFGIRYPKKKRKKSPLEGWLLLCTCHESTKT